MKEITKEHDLIHSRPFILVTSDGELEKLSLVFNVENTFHSTWFFSLVTCLFRRSSFSFGESPGVSLYEIPTQSPPPITPDVIMVF